MAHSVDRYRAAEARFWLNTVGELPSEAFIRLPSLNTRVRLLTYGRGPTLLFVHGGPNAASTWLPLIKHLSNFQCVLLERPGCGLSELPAKPPSTVRQYAVQIIDDALTALDTTPAAIIASSFGSYCVLAFAVAHPSRLAGMVHMGCPALVPGAGVPIPFLLPMIPLVGSLMRKLAPPTLATSWQSFQRMGHPVSLQQDIAELIEWYTALMRDTPTQANDQTLFGRIRPRDALSPSDLARLQMPMSFFWGEADTFGNAAVGRTLTTTIPHAKLELVANSGHVPWLDAPQAAATHVQTFFAA